MTSKEYLFLESRWDYLYKERRKLQKELEKIDKEMNSVLKKINEADLTKAK